jgi:hypothetical protein
MAVFVFGATILPREDIDSVLLLRSLIFYIYYRLILYRRAIREVYDELWQQKSGENGIRTTLIFYHRFLRLALY